MVILLLSLIASVTATKHEIGFFSGRISRMNEAAGLARVRIDFNNGKFLNKNNHLESGYQLGMSIIRRNLYLKFLFLYVSLLFKTSKITSKFSLIVKLWLK